MTGNLILSIIIEKELHFKRGWSFHRNMDHCSVIMGYDYEQSVKKNYEKRSIEHWNDFQNLSFDVPLCKDMTENFSLKALVRLSDVISYY